MCWHVVGVLQADYSGSSISLECYMLLHSMYRVVEGLKKRLVCQVVSAFNFVSSLFCGFRETAVVAFGSTAVGRCT